MAETIKARLKDASGNILHPETDWSVVQNKPFQVTKDSSNDNVLTISGFDYFKFGGGADEAKYSFGYCHIGWSEGTSPITYKDIYAPAFVVTTRTHRIGTPAETTNTYYRYNFSNNTWETFASGSANMEYIPKYFH